MKNKYSCSKEFILVSNEKDKRGPNWSSNMHDGVMIQMKSLKKFGNDFEKW